jgi:hypothetical protein
VARDHEHNLLGLRFGGAAARLVIPVLFVLALPIMPMVASESTAEDQMSLVLHALREDTPSACESSEPSVSDDELLERLLGYWQDSKGNAVRVHRVDGSNLTATLSKAGRPDIHLGLWKAAADGVWHCGDATLDRSRSSAERVTWVFWRGSVSVWTRNACTMQQESHLQTTSIWPANAGMAQGGAMGWPMFVPVMIQCDPQQHQHMDYYRGRMIPVTMG